VVSACMLEQVLEVRMRAVPSSSSQSSAAAARSAPTTAPTAAPMCSPGPSAVSSSSSGCSEPRPALRTKYTSESCSSTERSASHTGSHSGSPGSIGSSSCTPRNTGSVEARRSRRERSRRLSSSARPSGSMDTHTCCRACCTWRSSSGSTCNVCTESAMSGSGSVEIAGPLICSASAAGDGSSTTTGAGATAAGTASDCDVAAAAAAAAAALASRADMGAAAAGGAAAGDDDCSAAAAADDGAAASAFSEGLSAGSAAADVDTGVAASAAARRSRRLPAEVTAEATAICVEARWKALLDGLDGLADEEPSLICGVSRVARENGAFTFTEGSEGSRDRFGSYPCLHVYPCL
jgi:hypothetical protein